MELSSKVLSFLAWKLAQQCLYTTCTLLVLLALRFVSVEVAPRGELDDDFAIVLIVSAFMGACLSGFFGVAALALQAFDQCCRHVQENFGILSHTLGGQPSSSRPSKVNSSTKAEQAQQDKQDKQDQQSEQARQAQQVGRILDALSTVMDDSWRSDLDDETNQVWDVLRFWEDKMISFDEEEEAKLTKLVLILVAQKLCVVLSEFVNSQAFDDSKTTHVDVANVLACIQQTRDLPTSESSTEQHDGSTSRCTQSWDDCIEKAKEYQEVLESIKQAVHKRTSLYDLDNTGNTDFPYQLDGTCEKLSDLSEWLEMFDPADRSVLFKTIHDLLKPELVCVLSWFVESRVFRIFDAKHAKALKVVGELRSFDSPACCDKYKLEQVIEHIFELMAASNLDTATFGDWAPSLNHPKLALLEQALSQQANTIDTNQAVHSNQPDQAVTDLLAQFQTEALRIRVTCSVYNPSLSKDASTWQEVRTKANIADIRENNMMAFLQAKATRAVNLYSTSHDVVLAV